jgi:TM2 domain-containing membrane protein YozV
MSNYRRGIARLLLAWFGLWIVVGGYGYLKQDRASQEWLILSAQQRKADPGNWASLVREPQAAEMAFWSRQAHQGAGIIKAALFFGLFLPMIASVVGGLGYWIWRGFRPDAQLDATQVQHRAD